LLLLCHINTATRRRHSKRSRSFVTPFLDFKFVLLSYHDKHDETTLPRHFRRSRADNDTSSPLGRYWHFEQAPQNGHQIAMHAFASPDASIIYQIARSPKLLLQLIQLRQATSEISPQSRFHRSESAELHISLSASRFSLACHHAKLPLKDDFFPLCCRGSYSVGIRGVIDWYFKRLVISLVKIIWRWTGRGAAVSRESPLCTMPAHDAFAAFIR